MSLERTASHLNLWEEAAVVTALSRFAAIALASAGPAYHNGMCTREPTPLRIGVVQQSACHFN